MEVIKDVVMLEVDNEITFTLAKLLKLRVIL